MSDLLLDGFFSFFGKKSPATKPEILTEDANVAVGVATRDKPLKEEDGIATDPIPATKTERRYGDWKVKLMKEESKESHKGGQVGKTPMDPITPPAPGTKVEDKAGHKGGAVPAAPAEEGKTKPTVATAKASEGLSSSKAEAAKLIKEAFGIKDAEPVEEVVEQAVQVETEKERELIEVCTDPFYAKNRKDPIGTGSWTFSTGERLNKEDLDESVTIEGDYKMAVVKAKAWAKSQCVSEIYVQPLSESIEDGHRKSAQYHTKLASSARSENEKAAHLKAASDHVVAAEAHSKVTHMMSPRFDAAKKKSHAAYLSTNSAGI